MGIMDSLKPSAHIYSMITDEAELKALIRAKKIAKKYGYELIPRKLKMS